MQEALRDLFLHGLYLLYFVLHYLPYCTLLYRTLFHGVHRDRGEPQRREGKRREETGREQGNSFLQGEHWSFNINAFAIVPLQAIVACVYCVLFIPLFHLCEGGVVEDMAIESSNGAWL